MSTVFYNLTGVTGPRAAEKLYIFTPLKVVI